MRWRRPNAGLLLSRRSLVCTAAVAVMSLPAILWAMYEAPARTNPTEKCVLMVLAEHANPSGANAFPSWERIAKTVGVSTRTIGSTLSSLQAKGLIRRGDQRIAEAAVRSRGKSRAYAPTVWDLVMDGSHAAATQAHLPPAIAEDREATASRRANAQFSRHAGSADLNLHGPASADTTTIPAGQEPCGSCRSTGDCSEACSLTSVRHEISRRPGVKPASDEPSTSTKNSNPPPPTTLGAAGRSRIHGPTSRPSDLNGSKNSALGDDELDGAGFVAAVRSALPQGLARQSIGRPLERSCSALAAAGWTAKDVAEAVRGRCWDGAGVGAVVAWLADLRHECQPTDSVPLRNSTAAARGPDLVEEYRRALTSAAPSDSPARADALRLAAASAAKARARRSSHEILAARQLKGGL